MSAVESEQKGFQGLFEFQAAVIESLSQSNQRVYDRWSSEGVVIGEFARKLTGARSIPDAASAYQDLSIRHMEMAVEDARSFWTDIQKLAQTGSFWWVKRAAPSPG